MLDLRLAGKSAIVAGGSRGIGLVTAHLLAREGADLIIAGRKLPDLEKAASEIKCLPGKQVIPLQAHVGKTDQVANLIREAQERLGRIDILVNCAGANPTMDSAMDVDEAAWDAIMSVNLKGLFFLSQGVARIMKTHGGGSIVNLSSAAGVRPSPRLPVYSISKAGVIMATRVMAREWGKFGIRVNCVVPGVIRTQFSQALWNNPKILDEVLAKNVLPRIGEPDEVAALIVYLASDLASYVTGATFSVDGGETS